MNAHPGESIRTASSVRIAESQAVTSARTIKQNTYGEVYINICPHINIKMAPRYLSDSSRLRSLAMDNASRATLIEFFTDS